MAWVDITKGVNLLNAMRDGWVYFTEVSKNREDPYVVIILMNVCVECQIVDVIF